MLQTTLKKKRLILRYLHSWKCRVGTQMDSDVYLCQQLQEIPSYGIFPVSQDFLPGNKALAINSVHDNLQSREVYAFKHQIKSRNYHKQTEEEQEHAESLWSAKDKAINPDDGKCPIQGCVFVFSKTDMNYSRRFDVTALKWVCPPCLYHAEQNDRIPPPVVKSCTSHDPNKVGLLCNMSWCTTLTQNDEGLIRRMWHEGVKLWVCTKCFEYSKETIREDRPMRDQCD
jgi:hypothetical protein